VLLSSATAELLHGYRPQTSTCATGGGVPEGHVHPEHVFQVVVPDLPDAFPR